MSDPTGLIIAGAILLYILKHTKRPAKSVKEIDNDVTLWCNYFPTYVEMLKHPRARATLWNHPGAKFMRKGLRILTGIIFIIYMVGVNT